MTAHAERLGWAATWFRWFSLLNIAAVVLGIIGIILVVLSGESTINRGSITAGQLVANGVAAIVGGLITAFLWRVAYIICDFLSDFASDLATQQIRRERQNEQRQ